MTIDLVTEPEHIRSACREILTATTPAQVAVAFWGRGAIEALGVRRSAAGTRLIVNAESGCCHPQELRELLAMKHIKVRTLSRLHAKTWIGASRMLVGSANASSNGLGFQRSELSGWREACVAVEAPEAIASASRWFELRWSEGADLTEAVIRAAEAAWLAARANAAFLSKAVATESGESLRMELDGKAIYVVVTDEDNDISERAFADSLRRAGLTPSDDIDYYQNWARMPKEALLLAFGAEKDGGKLFDDGEWLTRFPVRSLRTTDGKRAYPVIRATAAERKDFGCPVTAKLLKKAVHEVVEKLPAGSKALGTSPGAQYKRKTDWCIPLHEFVEYCVAQGITLPPELA